ncbi:hypothetical protein PsYK624_069460 [Phanerochaete sordida]|uniref:Uncharacterized protein n=1 Tax=Phanerochaete sordida TaxID=48140 RepID=A0A9P3G7Q1_9APHY|nr:hypothetical protein PsYK624_069460 [Phanerochaete sordida]
MVRLDRGVQRRRRHRRRLPRAHIAQDRRARVGVPGRHGGQRLQCECCSGVQQGQRHDGRQRPAARVVFLVCRALFQSHCAVACVTVVFISSFKFGARLFLLRLTIRPGIGPTIRRRFGTYFAHWRRRRRHRGRDCWCRSNRGRARVLAQAAGGQSGSSGARSRHDGRAL